MRVFLAAAVMLAFAAAPAHSSQLIDHDATNVKLAVNAKGEALVTYTAAGKLKHVLAWGAVNAIAPTTARAQVALKLDYAGGNPLDTFGRNIYIDTFNSVYGSGWKRENSFLTHTGSGVFCYSFNPHGAHPAGKGTQYRATVEGPGVTPDIMWQGTSPGPYDKAADATANAAITALGDRQCKAN